MRRPFRWVSVLLLAGAVPLCITCAAGTSNAPHEEGRDGAFIHVSAGPEDPHRVLMALKMAEVMAADHDVLMYFDIRGVYVLLSDAPNIEREPFASAASQIPRLLDAGVGICVCPTCLQVAGKTAADLMPGISIADKDAFFDFTDGRILSLDY